MITGPLLACRSIQKLAVHLLHLRFKYNIHTCFPIIASNVKTLSVVILEILGTFSGT